MITLVGIPLMFSLIIEMIKDPSKFQTSNFWRYLFFGFLIVPEFIRMVLGKEVVYITKNKLVIKNINSLLDFDKAYNMNVAKNFSCDFITTGAPLRASGVIKFDYGADTIRFGESLTEAEGKILLEKIKSEGLIN